MSWHARTAPRLKRAIENGIKRNVENKRQIFWISVSTRKSSNRVRQAPTSFVLCGVRSCIGMKRTPCESVYIHLVRIYLRNNHGNITALIYGTGYDRRHFASLHYNNAPFQHSPLTRIRLQTHISTLLYMEATAFPPKYNTVFSTTFRTHQRRNTLHRRRQQQRDSFLDKIRNSQ